MPTYHQPALDEQARKACKSAFLSMESGRYQLPPLHPAARFAALLHDAISRTRTQIKEHPHEKDKSRTGATVQYRRHQSQPLQVGTKHRRRMQARAQLVVLQELHNSLYFCQTEDTRNFDLAEPVPARPQDSSANWPGNSVSFWSRPYSNGAQPARTITRRWCSTPTVPSQEPTARCTSPTIRLITRNFISPRAT